MNMKLLNKPILRIVTFSLILSIAAWVIPAEPYETYANGSSASVQAEESQGVKVESHTKNEIRQLINSNGAKTTDEVTYKEKPSVVSPYNPGQLSDKTLNSALKMVNQIRYIAGLSSNVILNDDYNQQAQAASLVNCVNQEMSHHPKKPQGMDDALFELGEAGAGKSNLGWGYRTINSSILEGYMEDGGSSNIDRVGHRRWVLNPAMSAVGFGYCENQTAMYAHDQKNHGAPESGVIWPAQTMPTSYFGVEYPWSISMGYVVDKEKVQVTLERLKDHKTWEFKAASSDGYFNVNNVGYGQTGCIIFRPENIQSYKAGDQFRVKITGLAEPVSYTVQFFDLTTLVVKKSNVTLEKGKTISTKDIITVSEANQNEPLWTPAKASVIQVSDGQLKAVNFGTTPIMVHRSETGESKSIKATVVPGKVNMKKISSTKKQRISVSYSQIKGASGYEIMGATNGRFTQNKITKLVNNPSTTTAVITGAKSGKKYYVKARAYYTENGKKLYGAYSEVLSVKVK